MWPIARGDLKVSVGPGRVDSTTFPSQKRSEKGRSGKAPSTALQRGVAESATRPD